MSISKLLGSTMVAGAITTGDGAAASVAPGPSSTAEEARSTRRSATTPSTTTSPR
ncbi:MAG: hypothetical protein QOF54_1587, partial [Solirubrobacteraceae bacterium]|nr:hypothetical protein [Solirubrobacteraceae bacterium]